MPGRSWRNGPGRFVVALVIAAAVGAAGLATTNDPYADGLATVTGSAVGPGLSGRSVADSSRASGSPGSAEGNIGRLGAAEGATGSDGSGSGQTGSGQTGSGQTGSGEAGSGQAGSGGAGSAGIGSGETSGVGGGSAVGAGTAAGRTPSAGRTASSGGAGASPSGPSPSPSGSTGARTEAGTGGASGVGDQAGGSTGVGPTSGPSPSGGSTSGPASGTGASVSLATTVPGPGLLWSDEFDGAAGSAPDPATWITQSGYGWGDHEMQCYTDDRRNLATDGHGNLVITAYQEPSCGGARYSSARIETLGKKSIRYGYVETRAILPTGQGAFPAVWLLGSDMPEVGWPANGELDIVEAVSSAPTTVHTNIHGVDRQGAHWQATWGKGGMYDAGVDLSAAFHTYGVEWTASALRFYFDGRLIRTIVRNDVPVWLWDKQNYLIMNVAINADGATAPASAYPQRMVVDYVRVYPARP